MQTYTCPFCSFHFTESGKQWDSAIAFGECPQCSEPLRNFPGSVKLQEGNLAGHLARTPVVASSVQPIGVPLAPKFCSRCGAPTKVNTKFCTKCGGAFNYSAGTSPKDETPSAPQPKQQEGKTATQQPYPWGTVLIWAFLAFLLGFTTARPTWKSATAIDQSVLGVFIGAAYAAITAIIVGSYKYVNRKPNQFLGGSTWSRVTAEEAKKHPLYGVGGWLSCFASVLVVGLIQQIQPIALQAFHDVGPANWWVFNTPIIRALKFALVIYALAAIIIYLLLFSRHRNFRLVSSFILLSIWPAQAFRSILDPSPTVADALAISFLSYVLHCVVGVTYLQRSKRVRVTFEHSVKADHDNAANTSLPSSSPRPALTRESAQERQFNDASTGIREQVPPSGTEKDMSSTPPTVKPTVPIAKPSQDTTEAYEDRLYAQIAKELDTDTVDKAIWTKVYAQAGGDEKQTRVLYIKARYARLRDIKDA